MMRYVFLITALLCTAKAYGDANGSLALSGHIPLHFDIRIQPEQNNIGNIDLENGETNLKVADVLEVANVISGYTISLESANAGNLVHNNGTSSVPYQIQYSATGTPVTPPAVGSPTVVKTSGTLVGLTFNVEEVFFTTPANANMLGGAYTDSITLSIQAL